MNRTHWPIGTYRFNTIQKYAKRRRNMTYAHLPTKFRKSQQQKKMLIIVVAMFTLLVSNIFYTAINKMYSSSFSIYPVEAVVEAKADAVTIAEQNVLPEERSSGPLSVKDYVKNELIKNGINADYAFKIIQCESGWDLKAKNPKGTATGLFQFTSGTWQDGVRWRGLNWELEDRKDLEKSTDMAIWFILKEGWGRWDCKNLV